MLAVLYRPSRRNALVAVLTLLGDDASLCEAEALALESASEVDALIAPHESISVLVMGPLMAVRCNFCNGLICALRLAEKLEQNGQFVRVSLFLSRLLAACVNAVELQRRFQPLMGAATPLFALQNDERRLRLAHFCHGDCGKSDEDVKIHTCMRCRSARYCSRSCQAAHWKVHKRTCKPAADAAVDTVMAGSQFWLTP